MTTDLERTGLPPRSGLRGIRAVLLLGVSCVGPLAAMGAASAQTVVPGFDATQLARNDDGSTGAVALPFRVNYFGTSYSQIYVNNNGNMTFGSASGNFTPVGLGADYRGAPIIAPFLADIDTRNPASGVTAYGTGTYAGRAAFGVTWPGVGYFSNHADRTNTFQAILTNRADTGRGNFDIYFNYDRIQFETGDANGGRGGLGGTSAAAGFSAGTGAAGSFYELPGSMVNGALIDGGANALIASSNNGVLGQFLFPVRNGSVMFARVCQAGDNASTTTVANCGPNRDYTGGILYTPTNPFTLNVLANTTITGASGASAVLLMPTGALNETGDAAAPPTASVTVNVAASAALVSDRAGIEIDGSMGSGAGTVTNAGRITAGTVGVLAQTGSGAATLTNSGTITAPVGLAANTTGVARLSNTGTIAGATYGLVAQAAGGSVSNAGSVTFGRFGVAAATVGPLAVTNTGSLTHNPAILAPTTGLPTFVSRIDSEVARLARLPADSLAIGVGAISGQALQITNSGAINLGTTGYGIGGVIASASGVVPGTLTIANTGTVTAGTAAIAAVSSGGGIAVTNAGRLEGATGIFAAVTRKVFGSVQITNTETGQIFGGAGYAIDTGVSRIASLVDNRGLTVGALNLAAGSAFSNSGQFVTGGTSSFGGGTIANTGTIALAGVGVTPVQATFGRVGSFENAGTIDLRTGSAANSLTVGGDYVGRNGSVLLEASTQAGTSDRLVIAGNATGTSRLFVNNLTPGTPFSVSPVLVQVNGSSAANAFTLASAQNFGAVETTLVSGAGTGGGTAISLASVPNAVGLSAPTAVIAARTIGLQGGAAVLDRMTQLRENTQRAAAGTPSLPPQAIPYADTQYAALVSKDPIAPNVVQPAPAPAVRPAMWARAFGDLERRSGSTSFSFAGANFTRDLGYTQSTGGLLAGSDVVLSGLTSPDDGLIVGVMGGYTVSTVNLNQRAGRQDYDGGTVGAYATYLKGPAFVDALFKVDLLGLDITAPGLLQRTGLQNYSFITNVGYRIPLQNAVYVEPTAGLEYVDTQFGRNSSVAGIPVVLRNGDALRGRIGARVGSEWVTGDIRIEPSITGYVYSVLTESGVTGAFNGVSSVTGLRDEGKVRGEVQASLNFFNLKTGLSGFVRADYRVGNDLVAGGGRVGMRYQW